MKEDPSLKKLHSLSDTEILIAISNHNKEALTIFYERYASRIFGLAIKILKDQSLAEDALQECFLTIWQKAQHFSKNKGSPFSWIMRLCRNQCIDMLRHQESKNQRLGNYSIQVNVFDEVNTPLDQLEEKDEQQLVQNYLRQLPQEQREVLEMAFFKGMSQSEIAQNTGFPLGTIKTRIRLGMKKLKGLIFPHQ